MKRTQVFKPTNDDWYPNYPDNLVRLCYIGKLSDGTFRVAVWGADDCGMEKDFLSKSDAIAVFVQLEAYSMINKADLAKRGFRHA